MTLDGYVKTSCAAMAQHYPHSAERSWRAMLHCRRTWAAKQIQRRGHQQFDHLGELELNSCCREKPGSQLNAGGIPITVVVGRSILRNTCNCYQTWDGILWKYSATSTASVKKCEMHRPTHWPAISKYCISLGSFCRSLSVMRFRKGFDRPELWWQAEELRVSPGKLIQVKQWSNPQI